MADSRLYNQTQKHTLSASISLSDTSIALSSFNFPDGTAIVAGDLGTLNFATIEPGTTREESITFTGVTSTTLTGVTRGIRFDAPYTQDTSLRVAHAAGAILVLSNTAAFYDSFANKENDETINGIFSFAVVPNSTNQAVSGTDLVNLTQLNAAATGSANIDRLVIAGTAGATIALGDWVFLDPTDSEWKLTDASVVGTTDIIKIGIAQGAGTDGNPIANGILVSGLDTTQTGLTANNIYFLSDVAGAISLTPGTIERPIGIAISTTQIVFDPYFRDYLTANEKDAATGNLGTPGSTDLFVTQTGFQKGAEVFAADAGSNDTYVITLAPVPTALFTGMVINFTANTINTGAATLNVNSLGAKTIKKNHDQDLATGDIESGQITTVVYDGTNFQMQSQVATDPAKNQKLTANGSIVSIASSTTETDLISVSVPGGTLGTANGVKARLWIRELGLVSGASCTFRLKYGSTTLVTFAVAEGAVTTSNRGGVLEAVIFANASTSAQFGALSGVFAEATNAASSVAFGDTDSGTAVENSTGALDFKITAQMSASSASNKIKSVFALVEIFK